MKLIKKIRAKFSVEEKKQSNIVKLPGSHWEKISSNYEMKNVDEVDMKNKRKILRERERRVTTQIFNIIVVVSVALIMYIDMTSHFIYKDKTRETFNQLDLTILELRSESAALAERVSELEETTENEYEGKESDNIPIDEKSLYYGKNYKDLWCSYDSDDKAVALLSGISKIQYGTAGCSLQMMARGVDFIVLSQMSETQWKEIPIYLKTLTPAQLDYLSFRMLDAYHFAQSVINREGLIADIESMGITAETYESCTEVQTIKFLSYMFTCFEENGVKYEWEKYDVLSLFN